MAEYLRECYRDINSGVNIELAQFGNNPHAMLSKNANLAKAASEVWAITHPDFSTKPSWKN
ncbi:hypothetical protein A0J48_024835 [Sphaerospermopsis aphanizomenoides BCCUSP55]|uniref:hypothetical protein n=1 Tax=Sphaerospermopsis aphanizomenoides TaxID=459663 RepID=UPI001902E53A|nr:hypothetical protein [Sphaerospermopsis aphanizomenoides]MBK1990702.1 hypothetical protein [Sphaerospermopsis aphanizomenoides BCCUSP55]